MIPRVPHVPHHTLSSYSFNPFKIERKRSGEVVKNTTFRVRKKESIFPVLKVSRQCPLVLLVDAAHFMGIRFYLFNITPEGLHYSEI
jgi:hypothetical protein